ncbi:MAG: hypothetical protein FGM41_05040, partial [Bacteroidetes bacterium]|nr:hypothetical protein [Bacteroidota bacterium]
SLLDQQLFHVKSLNNSGNIFTDKLLILTLALNFGLKVPKTIVTSVKSDLFSFFKIQDRIITKPINSGKLVNEKMEFWAPAKEVKVGLLPNEFLPSLFQEYIDKALDIRVFILGAKVYSTAIFSQNSELTEVDFRTNTEGQINKIVPFKLPIKITKLLLKLMKSLKLTSGVVDLLYKDNEFIFLEINPSGQFSDISNSCNFYLEKEIAKFLCQEIN